MIRITLTAAALAIAALAAPAQAEIVPASCKLIKYGDTTTVETFPCQFRQSGGNVTVDSQNWAFTFLAKDQGVKYIRINRIPLTFTKSSQYTLEVTQ